MIEVVAEGIPAGLGAPVYAKLDSELASALMSINAVKGVEIGDGFATAAMTGEENADEMRMGNDGKPVFLSNHAGGILGGISTGQPIVARFAVKPTSSILVAAPDHRQSGHRDRDRHQGPPRPLRRHPRRAGGRSDDGLRAGGPGAAASGTGGVRSGPPRASSGGRAGPVDLRERRTPQRLSEAKARGGDAASLSERPGTSASTNTLSAVPASRHASTRAAAAFAGRKVHRTFRLSGSPLKGRVDAIISMSTCSEIHLVADLRAAAHPATLW